MNELYLRHLQRVSQELRSKLRTSGLTEKEYTALLSIMNALNSNKA